MTNILKRLILIASLFAFLSACAPVKSTAPVPPVMDITNPYAPQPGDGALVRGTVEIVKTEILPPGSTVSQMTLKISFFVPTPCDQFRISAEQPGADWRINVEVYSLMTQGKVCTLMRLSTPTEATLAFSNVPAGHYSVWVNGAKAIDFDA